MSFWPTSTTSGDALSHPLRSLGLYRFGAETFSTGEIVETVVASSSMSFEDYVECKLFDLSVERFYTDQYLVEPTGWIGHLGLSVFDLIRTCHERGPAPPPRL